MGRGTAAWLKESMGRGGNLASFVSFSIVFRVITQVQVRHLLIALQYLLVTFSRLHFDSSFGNDFH